MNDKQATTVGINSTSNTTSNKKGYWQENLKILRILLSIWFIVSFLCSIVFVDQLDAIQIGGFKLGFWMAQQGSIYVFVILIFVYIKLMDKLDKKYQVKELPIAENHAGNEQ